ncbi:MAG: Ig-like domain-containing protein [Candidatus Symbiothrix sp.]|nr:Ig-like domain-containing protein [Candidatus Symbiothrix sp.]
MKQRTKRTWVACFVALWLVLPAAMQAQVHIGGNTDAVKGALLDLTTPEGSNLGLLPLNVYIDNINQIPDAFTNKASINAGDLQGLIVYNINPNLADGEGLYVWDGVQWNKVGAPVPATGVSVSPTTATLTAVGATQQLTPTIAPTNADQTVSYISNATGVATVNASTGLVTAVSSGTATITVTTASGKTATSVITVAIPATGVSVSPTTATLTSVGATQQLTPTITPTTAVKTVSYSSNATGIATVNATTGLVTAVSSGTATITVTTASGKTATSVITVAIPATGVSVSPTTATLTSVGATQQLTPTITPTTAVKTVSYSSNATGVATVNASTGLVTAVSSGTATITVTTASGKTATSVITVAIPATGVSVSPTTKAFTSKTTQQLTATILPATAVKTVTWSSNNTAVATVSTSGVVTAVGNGSATITVTTTSSKTATCAVSVSIAGASDAKIGSNTYATYCYGETIGCWMVTNSKEGTATFTSGNNNYYYWDARDNACASPWVVPNQSQWRALQNYLVLGATSAEKAKWTTGAELAGYASGGIATAIGSYNYWWSSTSNRQDFWSNMTNLELEGPGTGGTGRAFSVRCIFIAPTL